MVVAIASTRKAPRLIVSPKPWSELSGESSCTDCEGREPLLRITFVFCKHFAEYCGCDRVNLESANGEVPMRLLNTLEGPRDEQSFKPGSAA